jgi:hypothetical protein
MGPPMTSVWQVVPDGTPIHILQVARTGISYSFVILFFSSATFGEAEALIQLVLQR